MFVDDDIGLLAVERELSALKVRAEELLAAGLDDELHKLMQRLWALDRLILTMPPMSLAGGAVKLRRLCDPNMGLAVGESPDDLTAIGQVLAVSEQELVKGKAAA